MAWLYQRPDSEKWWIGYRVNGRQVLRSTGTSDRAEAEKQLERLKAISAAHRAGNLTDEFVALLTRKTSSGDTLRGAVKQWLEECKDLSERTLPGYRSVTNEFCGHVHATDTVPLLRDIRPESLASFIRAKRAKTSAATANANRRILSGFFSYCVQNQMLPVSPVPTARALKLDKDSTNGRRALTLVELKAAYSKAPSDFWRYMVLAGSLTGQRLGDLVTLRWGYVDFSQNQIRMTARKTGRAVVIPLHPALRAFLIKLQQAAGRIKPGDAIWPDEAQRYEDRGASPFSNEFYKEVLIPAGLVTSRPRKVERADGAPSASRKASEINFHCLRHTFVSLLKITGASQSTAKELAGHASDEISDLYTHVDEASLTRAIKQLPAIAK
jgi:integrase